VDKTQLLMLKLVQQLTGRIITLLFVVMYLVLTYHCKKYEKN